MLDYNEYHTVYLIAQKDCKFLNECKVIRTLQMSYANNKVTVNATYDCNPTMLTVSRDVYFFEKQEAEFVLKQIKNADIINFRNACILSININADFKIDKNES